MIGIFDSGLGGLTVLKEIKKLMPQYDYMYLGDTLHVPYGGRSDEAVFDLTKNGCDFLFEQGCELIIIACNTASAKALRKLQQDYLPEAKQKFNNQNLNILGVIRPTAELIAETTKGVVGVIGTKGTINSNIYEIELQQQNKNIKVFGKATPLLVPLIEEGYSQRKETKSILRNYLKELKQKNIDTLILGCTHYPLLIKQIRGIMGKQCFVPNPAELVAKSLEKYLENHTEIEIKKNGSVKYFATDLGENFQTIAQRFLQEKIKIEKITIN